MIAEPKCFSRNCRHFLGVNKPVPDADIGERPNCLAFPKGIPDEIAYGDNLHTEPVTGDNDIQFEYIDVDLCSREDREKIRKDIASRGGGLSYPTTIIDDRILINGFKENKLKEALGI